MVKIDITKEEAYWIERTADIESAVAMNKFTSLVNKNDYERLIDKEKKMVQKISEELIDLYTFTKELRMKLEVLRKDGK